MMQEQMIDNNSYSVACFGEVLWDVFPSGEKPGGAPMNVGYHLKIFGKNAALLTRIGMDERGGRLLQMFSGADMCTSFFQTDTHLPTGVVQVLQKGNEELSYEIVQPVAWDFIAPDQSFEATVAKTEFFVFGTLAARNETSRDTLFSLLNVAKVKVLDVNLRPPHYSPDVIEQLLLKADLVKMNVDELEILTVPFCKHGDLPEKIACFRKRYGIDKVLITMGAQGAVFSTSDGYYQHGGFRVQAEDAVGAGDAFLSGFLSQLLDKAPYERALEFACAAGALVATRKGACPDYKVEQVIDLIRSQDLKTVDI